MKSNSKSRVVTYSQLEVPIDTHESRRSTRQQSIRTYRSHLLRARSSGEPLLRNVSLVSPESNPEDKGARTRILQQYSQVAEVRHLALQVQKAVVYMAVRYI